MIESLKFVLLILASASFMYYVVAIVAARSFFSQKPSSGPVDASPDSTPAVYGDLPPVSIMIPMRGADFSAYENYAALCRQDYPNLQLVFGVRDPDDSSIPLVQKLRADFPDTAIDLAVGANEIGANLKVNNLNNMYPLARHDILVLMDSDIRAGAGFLKTMVAELVQAGAGLVTCLYRAGEAPSLAARFEAIGITAEFAPGVLVAEKTAGISFAFGAAIAIHKKTLAGIGGFASIADYLADDYMIGNLAHKAGYPVRLSRYVVETVLSNIGPSDFIKHQVRWARTIRACGRWKHAGQIITNGTVLSALYLALSGFSAAGWALFIPVAALRLAMARYIGVRCLGDQILDRHLPLVLLRDFLSFCFWCAALFGNRVEWRGKAFRIDAEGKMVAE